MALKVKAVEKKIKFSKTDDGTVEDPENEGGNTQNGENGGTQNGGGTNGGNTGGTNGGNTGGNTGGNSGSGPDDNGYDPDLGDGN